MAAVDADHPPEEATGGAFSEAPHERAERVLCVRRLSCDHSQAYEP